MSILQLLLDVGYLRQHLLLFPQSLLNISQFLLQLLYLEIFSRAIFPQLSQCNILVLQHRLKTTVELGFACVKMTLQNSYFVVVFTYCFVQVIIFFLEIEYLVSQ